MEVTNDGVFQPGLYKDHDGRRRGLGLPLMVSLADQVHVSRLESDKTQVSVTFFLDGYRGPVAEPAALGLLVESAAREEERLPLERALREVENRYKNLVDLSPDAITVDIDGTYVFANPAAARLFGARSPEELLGHNALDRVHPDDRDFIRERMGQVQSGAVTPPGEVRLLRLDGTLATVETSGSRVEFGGRLANQVVYRDITERKVAEEAAAAQRRTAAAGDAGGENRPV